MKKILHVVDSLACGGTEILLSNTLPILSNYENIIVYLGGNEALKKSFSNFQVYSLGYKGKKDILLAIWRLKKIIQENNISLIHSHLLLSTIISRIACPFDVKFVFSLHSPLGIDAFSKNRISLWLEKLTYKKTQNLIAVSNHVLKDYNSFIKIRGPYFVLHNFVADKYFNASYARRVSVENEIRLVAVGNLKNSKNYFNLLNALVLLTDTPYHLDIYGDGDARDQLQAFINMHKLNIRLIPGISDVSTILPNYDAYIMTSIYEGYGLGPMEAMAVGLPLLLSDLEVFREVFGNNHIYFNPLMPTEIASSIKSAWQNWHEFSQNSNYNRRRAFKIASKEQYAIDIQSIYRSILAD
jgi:glycosyltransferase involved in cell wall biosynthesis